MDACLQLARLALVVALLVWPALAQGESDKRVQIAYAYMADQPDRYDEVVGDLRRIANEMSNIVDRSAHKTGGHRHIRFVMNEADQVAVDRIEMNHPIYIPTRMRELGYDSPDRKYIVFVDIDLYCGFAIPIEPEGVGYGVVGRRCWEERTALHELMHLFGAVARAAPNATGGLHCTDMHDIMCGSDYPHYPSMRYLCPPSHWQLLDCNDDDYFHTNPPAGSFLAENPGANVANSSFLTDEERRFYLPFVMTNGKGDLWTR